ncbi:MAG: hypothetical protein ABJE00_04545 [Erythrobacter sp.]
MFLNSRVPAARQLAHRVSKPLTLLRGGKADLFALAALKPFSLEFRRQKFDSDNGEALTSLLTLDLRLVVTNS